MRIGAIIYAETYKLLRYEILIAMPVLRACPEHLRSLWRRKLGVTLLRFFAEKSAALGHRWKAARILVGR